jgi:two-component system, LytTR family, sensor kinase
MNKILENINRLPTRRLVYHISFWFVLLGVLTIAEMRSGGGGFGHLLVNELVTVFFYALIYYVNSEYLIPKYLIPNKLWQYLGFLIALAVIVTPIKVFVLFQRFKGLPSAQDFLIDNQGYYYLISLMTAGISTLVKITSDWVKQNQTQRELETRTMQTELNFLKSQINPHFLFNTLNSLYALTLRKSDDAPDVVIKLSEMMRYMLYECNEQQVFLEKEINYISNYLDLERLRHKKTDIRFEVVGEPDALKVAPLIFIAFIENAFKHGASNHLSGGFVHIHLHIEQNEVTLYVENAKPETQPTLQHKRSGGIGLVNVKRRLEIIYPKKYQLEIHDKPNTYGVNLWMEVNEKIQLPSSILTL